MAIRLLCDEHVGKAEFYPRLKSEFTVKHVLDEPDLGAGSDDEEIWSHADDINFNVFTNDTHFLDGTADPGDGSHPGVIIYDDFASYDDIIAALEVIDGVMSTSKIADRGDLHFVPGQWLGLA